MNNNFVGDEDYQLPFDTVKKFIIGARVAEKLPKPSPESILARESMTLEEQHRSVLPGESMRFKLRDLMTPKPVIEIIWPSTFIEEIEYQLLERFLSFYLKGLYTKEIHEWFHPYLTTNKYVILWPNEKVLKSIVVINNEEMFL